MVPRFSGGQIDGNRIVADSYFRNVRRRVREVGYYSFSRVVLFAAYVGTRLGEFLDDVSQEEVRAPVVETRERVYDKQSRPAFVPQRQLDLVGSFDNG